MFPGTLKHGVLGLKRTPQAGVRYLVLTCQEALGVIGGGGVSTKTLGTITLSSVMRFQVTHSLSLTCHFLLVQVITARVVEWVMA